MVEVLCRLCNNNNRGVFGRLPCQPDIGLAGLGLFESSVELLWTNLFALHGYVVCIVRSGISAVRIYQAAYIR